MKESSTQKELSLRKFLDKIKEANTKNPLESFLDFLPGMNLNKRARRFLEFENEEIKSIEAILDSMTEEELRNPSIINKSRRRRISKGAGVEEKLVREFLSKYSRIKRGISRKRKKLRRLKRKIK